MKRLALVGDPDGLAHQAARQDIALTLALGDISIAYHLCIHQCQII